MTTQKREYSPRGPSGRKVKYAFYRLKEAGDYMFIPFPDDVLLDEEKTRFGGNLRSAANRHAKEYFGEDKIHCQIGHAEGVISFPDTPDIPDGTPGFHIYRTEAAD